MILGIGVDLIEVERIGAAVTRFGNRFLRRIFTEAEIGYCQRRAEPSLSLAGRFAAKEALAKALETGIGRGVRWREVEVTRSRGGPPQLCLHGGALALARAKGVKSCHLSITHTQHYALAQVILEA